jgi:cell division protein FtsW
MDTQFKYEKQRTDHLLVASVLFLVGLGIVTLYSSSYAFSERKYADGLYLVSRQAILGLAGLFMFLIFSFIDLELLRKFIKPLVLGSILLCALTFVPGIGVTINGAARWIGYGSFSFQPSELVKFVLPLYLAHYFGKKKDGINDPSRGIIPPALMTGVFFVLIFLQNNFSTAVFLAFNALFIFFLAGVRFRYFFSALFMFLPTATILVLKKEHRIRRFLSYIEPDFEPQGAGYQVNSSILSISSGGFWGKGMGYGTRKIASVPEIHSDFIFSSFAEEMGFLGVMFFFISIIVAVGRNIKRALKK